MLEGLESKRASQEGAPNGITPPKPRPSGSRTDDLRQERGHAASPIAEYDPGKPQAV